MICGDEAETKDYRYGCRSLRWAAQNAGKAEIFDRFARPEKRQTTQNLESRAEGIARWI